MPPQGSHHAPRAQTNGVLPVTASQTSGNVSKPSIIKVSGPRLKVVIRRLAPGLTELEFISLLGDDWKVGKGKVDWYHYKPGKNSKDPSKPSRPARAYFHLSNELHLMSLSEVIKHTSFEDAQNTWNNSPALLGPPIVEFAPYGRVATGRRRVDARQGTIDQDPEFMDFLESLANPVSVKEDPEEGTVDGPVKGEKVTTTPLVQYLKDKKANKSKEAAAIKAAKHARNDSASAKAGAQDSSAEVMKKSTRDAKKEKLIEKAAREAVKVLNREAASKIATAPSAPAPEQPKNPRSRPKERGSIAAAARILQRDLGITPGNAHRRAKADAGNTVKAAESSSSQAAATPTAPKAQVIAKSRGNRNTTEREITTSASKDTPTQASPITLLKKPVEPAQPANPTTPTAPANIAKPTPGPSKKQPPVAVPSAGATKAFVKHANPSQGVTEALLKEAMEIFGAVSHVEIDKRKGFAYLDFVEAEGLVKAMAANPTKIAQGTVQVLERKDARPAREPPAGPSVRGMLGRGGRGGSRGGQRGGRGSTGGGRGSDASTSNAPPSAPTGPSGTKSTPMM